jgi:hypothetical protein
MIRNIKALIWAYVILLIFEGSLRKWVLPGYSDILLIIRDPLALAIYVLAYLSGRFPLNAFVIATFALAAACLVASLLAGQDNLLVTMYGLRIDFFHLPLIWVIASVMDRKDVERIGSFLLLVALPMTAIMILQFKSPADARINRGIGEDEGGQIFGADGKIRPPGFFSFITGPQLFFPLVAAFFFYQIGSPRRLPWALLASCGLAIIIALPVSISRTVMLATVIVGIAFVATMPFNRTKIGSLPQILLIMGVVGVGVSFLPFFREAREVFMDRWTTAAISTNGDAWGGIFSRIFAGFTQPIYWASQAPLFGNGIGVGSNVGARLLQGRVGFMLAEDEWGKVFLELGPLLGGAFISFRIAIACYMASKAFHALVTNRDNLPVLILSASAIAIIQNQWAPPTILGFAVLGAGLLLAAAKSPDIPGEEGEEAEEDDEDEAEEFEEEDEEIDVLHPPIRGNTL